MAPFAGQQVPHALPLRRGYDPSAHRPQQRCLGVNRNTYFLHTVLCTRERQRRSRQARRSAMTLRLKRIRRHIKAVTPCAPGRALRKYPATSGGSLRTVMIVHHLSRRLEAPRHPQVARLRFLGRLSRGVGLDAHASLIWARKRSASSHELGLPVRQRASISAVRATVSRSLTLAIRSSVSNSKS